MADDSKPNLPPPSKPFPGSTTPGWNDPPTLQATNSPTTRSRLNLNKRVGFPIQGKIGESNNLTSKPTAIVQPNQALVGPPLPSSGNIAVVHPMTFGVISPTSSGMTITPVLNSDNAFPLPINAQEFSLRVLTEKLPLIQESTNVKCKEIESHLGIIEQLWKSGNLSPQIQEKLYCIAKGIAENNFNKAVENYSSLVANHSTECTVWLDDLRHIVFSIQSSIENCVFANSNSIPSIFVPAMPRSQNPISTEAITTGIDDNTSTTGMTIEHL